MGTITVKVSDLTGTIIEQEEQAGRLVVEGHPNFPEPVTLEVLPEEIEGELPTDETPFVALSYFAPGEPTPRRYVLPLEVFNNLFREQEADVETVLDRAFAAQLEERGRGRSLRGKRIPAGKRLRLDYASSEHAGEPHRGRITDKEKEYVREHLDEVNARLREKGMRQIDPTDSRMVERYGLRAEPIVETQEPVEEAEVVEEEPPRG
jgi:hypothetical protein